MQWDSGDVRDAFQIFIKLLHRGEVQDSDLYFAYNQGDVRLILEEVVEKEAGVKIFAAGESLYISPGVDNPLFGYTNAQLREKMKLRDNSQLYLAYFVMLCLLAKFYNSDDQSLTSRQFLPLEELEENVTGHVQHVLEAQQEDVEEMEEATQLNLSSVAELWSELPAFDDTKKVLRRARNNRISFILQVLAFLEGEGLIQIIEDREVRLLPKMEYLVIKYYFHSQRKDYLLQMLMEPIQIPRKEGVE